MPMFQLVNKALQRSVHTRWWEWGANL